MANIPTPFVSGGGSSGGNGGFGALYYHNPNTSQDAQAQRDAHEQGRIQHHTPFGGPKSQFHGGAVQGQRFDWNAGGIPQPMSTKPAQAFPGIRGHVNTPPPSERPMLGVGEGGMPVVGAEGNIRITRDPQGETPYRFLTTDNVSYPDMQSAKARQALLERGAPSYMIEEQCPPPSVARARQTGGVAAGNSQSHSHRHAHPNPRHSSTGPPRSHGHSHPNPRHPSIRPPQSRGHSGVVAAYSQ